MKNSLSSRGKVLLLAATCSVLVFSCAAYSYGHERKKSIKPEELERILNIAGVESEVINLNRNDRFDTGPFFESKDGIAIVLGFSKNGFQKNRPFLLSILGSEVKAVLSTDGTLYAINDDGSIASAGIIDDILGDVARLVECILNSADGMVRSIDQCGLDFNSLDVFCILDAVNTGVSNIINCVF